MSHSFGHRSCPNCGGTSPANEVASDRRAETMSFEDLRAYWSGLFKEKVFFSYDRCADCGLLYAPAFFSEGQLGELYADMAPNMELVPTDALEATQRGYWDVARTGTALDGGYLEIGPDVGYIVAHAAQGGSFAHFWLVEPNRSVHGQLSASAQGKPHTIIEDMDDWSAVPDGSVGLAVMIHVLDHLLDPIASLRQIHAKLKPGGRLVIVTHNEKSVLRSLMRRRWPPFCLQHPQLFNPDSMQNLVARAGYAGAEVARSTNYFPIRFMARQAAYSVGLDIGKLPLPGQSIGLKLGNMITVARR